MSDQNRTTIDDLVTRARNVRMASCARHQERNDLPCYRARDAKGDPLDPRNLVKTISALADALEAEREYVRDRVVERDAALAEVERLQNDVNRLKEQDKRTVADGLVVLNKLTDARCEVERLKTSLASPGEDAGPFCGRLGS